MLAFRQIRLALPLILGLASAALYLPLFRTPFMGDDFNSLSTPGRYASIHSTVFRPVMAGVLVLSRSAFAMRPWHYHVGAALLQAIIALLLYHLLSRVAHWPVAAFATGLWALCPRSIEAVIWVSAAANELPYVLCTLTAISIWLGSRDAKGTPWIIASLYVVSLLAKQSAIILPALIILVSGYQARKASGPICGESWASRIGDDLAKMWPALIVFAVYAVFEFWQLHLAYDTPGHAQYGLVRPLELAHYLIAYPALAVVPFLSQSWVLPARHEIMVVAPLLALFWRWLRARDARTVGVAWFVIASLPTVLFAGFGAADEYFYLPDMGIALAFAAEISSWRIGRWRRLFGGALSLVVAGSFALTVLRWRADARNFSTMSGEILLAAKKYPHGTLVVADAPQTGRDMPEFMNAFPAMVSFLDPSWDGKVVQVDGKRFSVTAS